MKRHPGLFIAVAAVMVAIAAFADKKPEKLLILDWAARAGDPTPPAAVLIELGLKDKIPTPWSGAATVSGARVIRREGYRFWKKDELVEPDGWQATSHRPIRVPAKQPAVARLEGIATVGIVLHLADVGAEATLTVSRKEEAADKQTVSLKDILAGRPQPLWNGKAVIRLISTTTPVVTDKTEDDFPAAAYGPDGTLWLAYISYTIKDEDRRIEQKQLKQQPENFKALYQPEFGDQLFVKYYRDGKWSEPIAVTGPKQDLVRCAIAANADGSVCVAYSANRKGRYRIYTRKLDPMSERTGRAAPQIGPERQPGTGPKDDEPDLEPVMCTDARGEVHLAWRSTTVFSHSYPKNGFFIQPGWTSGSGSNWHPCLVAAPDGKVAVAIDSYSRGDYDVNVWVDEFRRRPEISAWIRSSRFEGRPSICYDPKGRLWIAYEEGPAKWGKDYGAFDAASGNPLYNERSVRVVCLVDGKLMRPFAELPTSHYASPQLPFEAPKTQGFERTVRYAYPKIGIDGKGRVWLTYRQKFGTRYTSHPGSYWLTFARRLDGDHWTEPIELHHSDGLLDSRPVLLPHKSGGLLVIHNTDGRYTTPETIDNQIYQSYVDLPGEPVEPELVAHNPGEKDPRLSHEAKAERAAVKRIRDYRIETDGKKLQLLRGEFHRHTELSWDGGADGSLEDMFRYAVDAAAMDWIGNGDHDNGAGREYAWWLVQKFSDAYYVKNAFTPMFTYERSVAYPMGHRNCMFAKRGVLPLPRLFEPNQKVRQKQGGVHPDDTKMLYRYLRELDGICASHTSATSMGTDWRDNDPRVEPIVEIYQGDRMSYEMEGAPRAGYDPKSDRKPANVAGWYPKGYIDHALKEKGYRLGFQSSSDHWSTHISFFIVLAERNDRDAILAAVKQRHCYGATDNIILDVRCGEHLMGDEFQTNKAPVLDIRAFGTKPLARVDILKDSQVVHTVKPGQEKFVDGWTDPKPDEGTHYYYVRVLQTDEQLAWSSPMWVEYKK